MVYYMITTCTIKSIATLLYLLLFFLFLFLLKKMGEGGETKKKGLKSAYSPADRQREQYYDFSESRDWHEVSLLADTGERNQMFKNTV